MSAGLRWTEEQFKNHCATRKQLAVVEPAPTNTCERQVEAIPEKASPAKAKTGPKAKESPLEAMLAQQMIAAGMPWFVRQHKHIPGRRLTLDFCWPEKKLGIEVQGMCHRIKGKFEKDIEKRALGLLSGWQILEVSGASIRSGQAIQWVAEMLAKVRE